MIRSMFWAAREGWKMSRDPEWKAACKAFKREFPLSVRIRFTWMLCKAFITGRI